MSTFIESLAERMKIAILVQQFWNPKRQHKTESREENYRHGLDKDAEVYIKLIRHDSLTKAQAVKGKIYTEHRRLTLPSPVDGMRVVPVGREWEHSQNLSVLRAEFDTHVQEFLNNYDDIVQQAKIRLKTLFDPTMFPPEHIMRQKFGNNIRYMECPTNGSWNEWLNETAELGKMELQDRLVSSARKLIDVCSGDGKLYSSVLDNLKEICEMAGDYNLLGDPIISKAASELLPVVTDFDADTLRESKVLRNDVGERARQILSVLNLS